MMKMLDYRTDQAWEECQKRQVRGDALRLDDLMALCQSLAVEFYERHGYEVNRGHDFRNSQHPQEVRMWEMAKRVVEMCRLVGMDDVEDEYDEEFESQSKDGENP